MIYLHYATQLSPSTSMGFHLNGIFINFAKLVILYLKGYKILKLILFSTLTGINKSIMATRNLTMCLRNLKNRMAKHVFY